MTGLSAKRVVLYGILLGVMLLVILCSIGVLWVEQNGEEPSSPAGEQAVFVVGEWDGRLAVFENGQDTPTQWYEEVWVSSFPEEEQRRLAAGIRVTTAAGLAAVLEDYTA